MELTPTKRPTITLYESTPAQHRRYHPVDKAGIVASYQRQKKLLEARRTRAVKVNREYFVYEVDLEKFMFDKREVVVGQKRAKMFTIELWKLSEQDYQVYLGLLEEGFKERKREFNARLAKEENRVPRTNT